MTLHSQFVRALEAEYEAIVRAANDGGAGADDAHQRAFEHVKRQGVRVLDALHHHGRALASEATADGGRPPG